MISTFPSPVSTFAGFSPNRSARAERRNETWAQDAQLLEYVSSKSLQKYAKLDISYLHRTVRDYLEAPEIWESLVGHTNCTGFNPHTALLMGVVIEAKDPNFRMNHSLSVEDWGHDTLKAVNYYKLSSSESYSALIKEFDRSLGAQGNWVGFGTLKNIG